MLWDSIEAVAARFESGQLSTAQYLWLVEQDRHLTLPPAALDNAAAPSPSH